MHFPLDNSVCRVKTTCPLVRLDNLVAVPSKLMRCSFHSTAPSVGSRQLVRSYKLWKVFFHLCHVDSIGHDWNQPLTMCEHFTNLGSTVSEFASLDQEITLRMGKATVCCPVPANFSLTLQQLSFVSRKSSESWPRENLFSP